MEDDADARDVLTTLLEQEGYRVTSVRGLTAGLDAVRAEVFDLVGVDPSLLDLAAVERLVAASHPTPVAMLGGRQSAVAGVRTLPGAAEPSAFLQEVAAAIGAELREEDGDRKVVARYFRALEEHDWAGLGALLADDVVYSLEGAGETVRGRAAFQEFSERTFTLFRQAVFGDLRVFRTPHGVAARYRGEWLEPDGQRRSLAGAVVFAMAGGLIRSVGVRLDLDVLADSAAWSDHRRAQAGAAPRPAGFSTRQVAQLLGIGEASVKRLSDAGSIACLRTAGRSVRRFTAAQVAAYLWGTARDPQRSGRRGVAAELAQALSGGDIPRCVAIAVELFGDGMPLDAIVDEVIAPAARHSAPGAIVELSGRLSALSFAPRRSASVILVPFGGGVEASLAGAVVRANGVDVLTPVAGMRPAEIAGLAARARAALVVVAADGPSDVSDGNALAGEIAGAFPGQVCLCVRAAAARGSSAVALVRSARELAALVQGR